MKKALVLACLISSSAYAENQKFFSPHLYISSLAGMSFGAPTDFRPRHAPIQVGLALFETKNLFLGKIAWGYVIEARDTGNTNVGHALILSPFVWKIKSFDWGRSWNRESSFTADLSIDHRKRFIAALGFAF